MAKNPTHKRQQTNAVLTRLKPGERAYLEAASAKITEQLAKTAPGTAFTVGAFVRSGAFQWAEEVLGLTLEEFERKKGGTPR